MKTVKGNLFHAPLNSVLVHSCNTKGKWGAGIALEFRKRFPQSYSAYVGLCKEYGKYLLGTCLITDENGYKVASLFTSSGFGDELDSESEILSNTYKALKDLKDQLPEKYTSPICMPKINSGLFRIEWVHTEKVINAVLLDVTIYEV